MLFHSLGIVFGSQARTVIFEQELYDQFTYDEDKPYFHSFPGDVSLITISGNGLHFYAVAQKFMIGLNFASNQEATKFLQAIEAKIQYATRRSGKSHQYLY